MRWCIGLIIFALFSCSHVPESESDNVARARQLFDAFNRHDWSFMASLYADSAAFLDPSFGKEYVKHSHQQIIDKYSAFQQIFPDLKDEVTGIYSSGDKVIIEFTSSGTANGTSFKLPIATVLTIQEGRITNDATYYDLENP